MSMATSIFFNHSNFRPHARSAQWNGSTSRCLSACCPSSEGFENFINSYDDEIESNAYAESS